jgi:MFS family permease
VIDRARRLLVSPDFGRLWAAAAVSSFGSFVTRLALPLAAILVLGVGPVGVGVLRSAELIAAFGVGLVAGAWVDRLRRRPVMIWADLGRAALLASVPVAAVLGVLTLAQLLVVAFGAAILTTFFEVADRSFLPDVVPRDRLHEANATLTATVSVSEFVAFGAAGWLVQILTAPIAIAIDAASFLASAILLGRIRTVETPPAPVAERGHIASEIREGVAALAADPLLRPLAVANAAVFAGWGIFGATFLLFTVVELGFDPGVVGLIAAMGGFSAFIGAVVAGPAGRRLGYGRTLIAALAVSAVGNLLIPLAPGATLVGVACLVGQQLLADSALVVFEIGDITIRQTIVAERLLGRVNAGMRVTAVGAQLAGTIAGALIAEAVGLRAALYLGATLGVVGAVALALSRVRTLSTLPVPAEPVGRRSTADLPEQPVDTV